MRSTLLIAGGNSGVGLETIRRFDSSSHEIHCATRSRDNLESLPNVTCHEFENPEGLPESADGAVYFPGTIQLKPFLRLSDEDFQADWEVNFLGAVRFLRRVVPALQESKAPSPGIVLFSTVAVQTGLPFHASIAGAKAAIE
ncbi:MAG: SDR family oxidoreductase, partial [Verrucomicrobiales bacterium]|nr:SDR family oxidoreductase [Verrucomicrobiales bacterium]